MSHNEPFVAIEKLLSLNWDKSFVACDTLEKAEKTVYGIGNTYIPDHTLICDIPPKLIKGFGHEKVKVQIHIIWLITNTAYSYSGLVVDKSDYKLYFADVYTGDDYTSGSCRFQKASADEILENANKYNLYLNNVVDISLSKKEKLLDYQIYSNFSDRFYYMEVPCENKVVMCGVGLHTNKLLAVGWLGKLINKDFFVCYAECTFDIYEQLKKQNPSLYDRGQLMEKNKHLFSYFNVIFDKRRKYSEMAKIVLAFQKEPFSTRSVSCFYASPNGTIMQEYNGPAYRWMEEFLVKCRENIQKQL